MHSRCLILARLSFGRVFAFALAGCGGAVSPAVGPHATTLTDAPGEHNATSAGKTSRVGEGAGDAALLPENYAMDGYRVVAEHTGEDYVGPSFQNSPIELATVGVTRSKGAPPSPTQVQSAMLGVLSFGRRVVVSGATARLIDRRENPGLSGVMGVPDYAGGGYLFIDEERALYSKTFDGQLMPLDVSSRTDSLQAFFGAGSALFLDSMGLGSEEDDDAPGTATLVSLTNGKAVRPAVPGVRGMQAIASGRTLYITRDGELYYAQTADGVPRKLDLPKADNIESIEGELVVYDEGGSYVLGVAGDKSGTAVPVRSWSGGFGGHGSPELLRGRKVDEQTTAILQGNDLELVDAEGRIVRSKPGVIATLGSQNQTCVPVGSFGPFYARCESERGMSLHLIDLKTLTSKLEKTFPRKEQATLAVIPSPSGEPVIEGRCNGDVDQTIVCARQKDGSYKESNFLPQLKAAGVIDERMMLPSIAGVTPPGARRYYITRTLVPGDNGRIGMLVRNNEMGYLFSNDGRSVAFSFGSVSRRLRGLFNGQSPETASLWLGENGAYGYFDSQSRGFARWMTAHRFPSRKAFKFSIAFSGETQVTEYEGGLARDGAHVLRMGQDSRNLFESFDLGRTFREVPAPPGTASPHAYGDDGHSIFCAETICKLGPWLRPTPPRPVGAPAKTP